MGMSASGPGLLRRRLKTVRRNALSAFRSGMRGAAKPAYRLVMTNAFARRSLGVVLKRTPWFHRFLFRSLASVGFLPSIAAEMAASRGRGLMEGGADFTQDRPPSLSYRATVIAASLRAERGETPRGPPA